MRSLTYRWNVVSCSNTASMVVWIFKKKQNKKNISAIGITKRWKTVTRIKLKIGTCVLQEKHCPQEARCDSCRSSAEGRGVRSKILEWRRGLSLSQSALLGRLDCNESSQSKRDLLATAGEPALATLSGSRLQQQSQFAPDTGGAQANCLGQCRWALQSLIKLLFFVSLL